MRCSTRSSPIVFKTQDGICASVGSDTRLRDVFTISEKLIHDVNGERRGEKRLFVFMLVTFMYRETSRLHES